MLLADEKIWDQNGFNDLVHKQLGPSVDEESGLVYAFDGNLKLGILPASIFCSGHTYFVQVGSINSYPPSQFKQCNFVSVQSMDTRSLFHFLSF